MLQENFVKYEQHVDPDVRSAAPEVRSNVSRFAGFARAPEMT